MADDDFRTRRRREEKEAERLAALAKIERRKHGDNQGANVFNLSAEAAEKIEDLLERTEPLIEQVNALYQQYGSGVELRPPIERRAQLEQMIAALIMMNKPNAQMRFRVSSVVSGFNAYRERWERMLKDIETGKIKRITGPKSQRRLAKS